MDTIHRPERSHVCTPGWELVPGGQFGTYYHDRGLPEGTVVECSCGALWIGRRPYANVLTNTWQQLGWFAAWRWRRQAQRER